MRNTLPTISTLTLLKYIKGDKTQIECLKRPFLVNYGTHFHYKLQKLNNFSCYIKIIRISLYIELLLTALYACIVIPSHYRNCSVLSYVWLFIPSALETHYGQNRQPEIRLEFTAEKI